MRNDRTIRKNNYINSRGKARENDGSRVPPTSKRKPKSNHTP